MSKAMGLALGIGLGACLVGAGCGTMSNMTRSGETFALQKSNDVPAAQGQVTVTDDGKGNVNVKLAVDHLAPVERVRPEARAYVVWIKPKESGRPQNVGVMKVGDNRKGRFETKTPFRNFDVFVTAEEDPQVAAPSSGEMLRASVSPTTKTTF